MPTTAPKHASKNYRHVVMTVSEVSEMEILHEYSENHLKLDAKMSRETAEQLIALLQKQLQEQGAGFVSITLKGRRK